MSYVVLARKWRPQCFEDLVGQQHVSRTLANAIASDRVAHAFLLTGVRGVGKTSCARILAKALNCENGPTASPCQKCPACSEIPDGDDVDVREIDGASYNGVDEVRRLQESLPYQPSRDRFKIFVVDEVHMLSTAAWNAFLKTLEEPPPHVKFIFATTEAHKVPVTILSRCQRYDFKLISTTDIVTRLGQVLAAEKLEAEDEAVHVIGRQAAGSMRDAMSLLDQVIAWLGNEQARLTADDVAQVLGVASRSVLHQLSEALVGGKSAECFEVVSQLADSGYDLTIAARDFLTHLRDLMVCKVCDDPAKLLSLSDTELSELRDLAARSEVDDLSRLYLGLSRAFDDVVRSGQPRAALEMALVRLARRPPLVPVDDLLRRLVQLERRLRPVAGKGGGRGGGSSPATGRGATGGGPGSSAVRGASQQQRSQDRGSKSPQRAKPPTSPPAQRQPQAQSPAPQRSNRTVDDREPAASAKPPAIPAAQSVRPDHAGDGDEQSFLAAWRTILQAVAAEQQATASLFEHAAPVCVRPGKLVLGFDQESFIAEQVAEPEAVRLVSAIATAHFGTETPVQLDFGAGYRKAETVAQCNRAERAAERAAARREVAEHPLVKAAIDELGAELCEVRLPDDVR